MTFNQINYKEDAAVAFIEINRPKALNALNAEVISELSTVFTSIEKSDTVRAVVLTGSGEKSFVAGADIKEMEDFGEKEAIELSKKGQDVFFKIENSSKPVIAAVNGFTLGGGFELALSCDFIIASSNAKFGLPEVSLGLIPGYGGTQRLARNIGLQKAKRMIFSAEMVDAQTAYDWGLVTEVVELDGLVAKASKLATKISRQAPLAVHYAKQSVTNGFDIGLGEAMGIETHFFGKAFATSDKLEGVGAFLEKRKPQFKGQ